MFSRPLLLSLILSLCYLFAATDAPAHPAWGIAVDNQGQVYFSSLKAVLKIDTQGQLSFVRPAADRHTHEINLDDAGNLYGADNSYDPATERFSSAIWKLTPSGEFSYLLAPTQNPPTGTSIWKDRNGNMYHVTNFPEGELLVLMRSPQGDVRVLAGKTSAVQEYSQGVPYNVGGIAFGSDGTLFFTHGTNVSKLTPAHVLVPLARNVVKETPDKSEKETRLLGIAVDESNVFVADHGNQRVFKIGSNGQITTVIRNGDEWFPTGVALKGADLYVLEYRPDVGETPGGARVRKLSPDGSIAILAVVGEDGRPMGNPISSVNVTPEAAGQNTSRWHVYAIAVLPVIGVLLIFWLVRKRRANHID